MFAGGIAESRKLAGYYAALAAEMGCGFFDAGQVASASPFDGVHLDAANTRAIGAALVPIVRALLAD
jgi:lysophospholipase L1-like esterase